MKVKMFPFSAEFKFCCCLISHDQIKKLLNNVL